jgi:hypothetical protein
VAGEIGEVHERSERLKIWKSGFGPMRSRGYGETARPVKPPGVWHAGG